VRLKKNRKKPKRNGWIKSRLTEQHKKKRNVKPKNGLKKKQRKRR
jgi:hypothetical protein